MPARWIRFALLALLVSLPEKSSAKARILWKKVENLEAVVVRVETGDEPGDADWDIYLRPASPEAAAAFWSHFWAAGNQDWIDDDLAPAFAAAKGHLSAECKQCAGPGPEGAACMIEEGHRYDQNPCPRFFACAPCLYDLERMPGLDDDFERKLVNVLLQDVTVKGEIFFGQAAVENPLGVVSYADGKPYMPANDLNARLTHTMFELGFRDVHGQRFGDEGVVCNELRWKNGKYHDSSGKSICGKHVFISGRATLDQSHSNRPEVHPIFSIAVDDGMVGNHTRALRVGTFIDGSQDTRGLVDNWSFDYHEWGHDLLPSQVKLPISKFQNDAPVGHCVSPPGNGTTCENWIPECVVDNLRSFHANAKAVGVPNRCPDETVDMDWTKVNGAAWVSKVRVGWHQKDFYFRMDVKAAQPTGGVLADHAPAASDEKGDCVLPQGKYDKSKLRRWYRYRVTTHALFGGIPLKDIQWSWQRPLPGVSFQPELPAKIPEGDREFDLWLPVPDKDPSHYFYPDYEVDYGGVLKASAKVSGAPSVWASEKVEAPQPSVAIETSNAAVEANGNFKIDLTAKPEGFCGAEKTLRFDWDQSKSAVPTSRGPRSATIGVNTQPKKPFALKEGAGPIVLELQPGQLARVSVIVEDAFGVERAVDEIVLTAPELQVEGKISCRDKDGGASHQGAPPPSWPKLGTPQLWNENWCWQTQIAAKAFAIPHGVDAVFPESTVGAATFTWSDIKVAFDKDWTWQEVPQGWTLLHPEQPDRTLVIQPDKSLVFKFQAAVTVTDSHGRKATAHVTGSNDFSPLPDLRTRLERLWAAWHPGVPLPDPAHESLGDPMAAEVGLLLHNLELVKPGDLLAEAMVRSAVQSFVHFAYAKNAAEKGFTYARPRRAVFSAPETTAAEDRFEDILDAAHLDARRRLAPSASKTTR